MRQWACIGFAPFNTKCTVHLASTSTSIQPQSPSPPHLSLTNQLTPSHPSPSAPQSSTAHSTSLLLFSSTFAHSAATLSHSVLRQYTQTESLSGVSSSLSRGRTSHSWAFPASHSTMSRREWWPQPGWCQRGKWHICCWRWGFLGGLVWWWEEDGG